MVDPLNPNNFKSNPAGAQNRLRRGTIEVAAMKDRVSKLEKLLSENLENYDI